MSRKAEWGQSLRWDHPAIDPQPVHVTSIYTAGSLSNDLWPDCNKPAYIIVLDVQWQG